MIAMSRLVLVAGCMNIDFPDDGKIGKEYRGKTASVSFNSSGVCGDDGRPLKGYTLEFARECIIREMQTRY